jgi:hypothetical protein
LLVSNIRFHVCLVGSGCSSAMLSWTPSARKLLRRSRLNCGLSSLASPHLDLFRRFGSADGAWDRSGTAKSSEGWLLVVRCS